MSTKHNETMDYTLLGRRAKARRHAVNLSQTFIAKQLGLCSSTLSCYEAGIRQLPRGENADRWEMLLEVPPGWLRDVSIPTPDHKLSANWYDSKGLAERAATRRCHLGFSRSAVARIMGVSVGTLVQWEKKIPAEHRGAIENRWEDVLRVPRGWLRDVSILTPDQTADVLVCDLRSNSIHSVVEEIRAVGVFLSQPPNAVVRVSKFTALSKTEKSYATMFANRYGARGRAYITFQASGDIYDLTRERVRQVIKLMKSRSNGPVFVLPNLNRLKKITSTVSANSIAQIEKSHRALLGPKLRLADADRFAQDVLGYRLVPAHEESI